METYTPPCTEHTNENYNFQVECIWNDWDDLLLDITHLNEKCTNCFLYESCVQKVLEVITGEHWITNENIVMEGIEKN